MHQFTSVEEGMLGMLVRQGKRELSFFHRSLPTLRSRSDGTHVEQDSGTSAQQSSALGLRDRLASGMGFRNWQLARERTHVVGAATGAQRRGGERAAGRGPSYRTSL
jgi:hypothetical protein